MPARQSGSWRQEKREAGLEKEDTAAAAVATASMLYAPAPALQPVETEWLGGGCQEGIVTVLLLSVIV